MSCVCIYSRISEEKIMFLKFSFNISKGDGEGVGIEMERSTSRYFWEILKYRFQEIEGLAKMSRNSKFTRLTFPFHTLSQKKNFFAIITKFFLQKSGFPSSGIPDQKSFGLSDVFVSFQWTGWSFYAKNMLQFVTRNSNQCVVFQKIIRKTHLTWSSNFQEENSTEQHEEMERLRQTSLLIQDSKLISWYLYFAFETLKCPTSMSSMSSGMRLPPRITRWRGWGRRYEDCNRFPATILLFFWFLATYNHHYCGQPFIAK